MGVKINLSGKKYRKLTVLRESDPYISPSGRSYVMWDCLCECGNKVKLRTSAITSKSSCTHSCGCFSSESTGIRSRTHGMSKSTTYTSWNMMVKRCHNKNDPYYDKYGGRGITVCERWRKSFEEFLKDMGVRPTGTSIDRIDNNKGYYKENCRWATKSEQQINRRKLKGSSKYRGVSWSNYYNVFKAQINILGKNKHIGNFNNELDAAIAYDKYVIDNNLPQITNGLINRLDHKKENREKENGKKF